MIPGKLWIRYVLPVLLAALSIYGLCVLGFFAYHKAKDTHTPNRLRAYAARIVDLLADEKSPDAERLESDIRFLFNPIWLVDDQGKPLSPFSKALPVPWGSLPHPSVALEPTEWNNPSDRVVFVVVKLKRHPNWYFISRWGPPLNFPHSALLTPILIFALLSLIIAILSTASIVFVYFRAEAKLAESVFRRIEKGDLEARFPIRKLDDVGKLLSTFNRMADEIERLVIKLRRSENARIELLEDLGHDLRTPLTSSTSLVETLIDYGESMQFSERQDSLSLIRQELGYLHRLLGDLFLLAGMGEASYQKKGDRISIVEVLRAEVENQRALFAQSGKNTRINFDVSVTPNLEVVGDKGLLQRLIRNALENARRFASSEVSVGIGSSKVRSLEIRIKDDGPGFDEKNLATFGQRRATRVESGAETRLSLGLGSVIMRTIAELHGGRILVGNHRRVNGEIGGAEIVIVLPFPQL